MNSQDIDHSLEFSINTKKMDRYICDMQLFGDTMELVYVNEVIYMRSNGDDGKYCLKLTVDLVDDLIVEEDLRLMARVPLRFPAAVTKMFSVFEQIYIQISENAPFTFKMSDVGDENSELMKIIYYVAPKIEDDDVFDFSEFEQKDDICKNEIVE
jgi:DNA polymerase III sliding clamp (beta) subunit (PCNA family)